MGDAPSMLTEDEVKLLQKDIEDAKSKLISKETDEKIKKAKDEAKKEALAEVEKKKAEDDRERTIKELQEKLEKQEKDSTEKLTAIQKKVDDMVASKAVITKEDPFKNDPNLSKQVDTWSDEKIKEIEENSAKTFFGDAYDGKYS